MYKNSYFSSLELACNCCGKNEIDDNFLTNLIEARIVSNTHFIINSGFRCVKHNQNIGGIFNSSHTKGLAVDISFTDNEQLFKILKGLFSLEFARILIYPTQKFIHFDQDTSKTKSIIKVMI